MCAESNLAPKLKAVSMLIGGKALPVEFHYDLLAVGSG